MQCSRSWLSSTHCRKGDSKRRREEVLSVATANVALFSLCLTIAIQIKRHHQAFSVSCPEYTPNNPTACYMCSRSVLIRNYRWRTASSAQHQSVLVIYHIGVT